ncbi:hypothetical protein Hdeb2414_s0019g00541031 [Helianthus debilis subsp. tardiflorus]
MHQQRRLNSNILSQVVVVKDKLHQLSRIWTSRVLNKGSYPVQVQPTTPIHPLLPTRARAHTYVFPCMFIIF